MGIIFVVMKDMKGRTRTATRTFSAIAFSDHPCCYDTNYASVIETFISKMTMTLDYSTYYLVSWTRTVPGEEWWD